MKADAEEDYVFAVNQASKDHADLEYHTWAKNMQLNEYRALYIATSNEYWRWLAETEQKDASRDKAAGMSISPSATIKSPIKKPKVNFVSKDTFFIDGYKESFGTIVGRYVRSYVSKDSKSSYFKTLGMNNIIDISDDTEGSHLAELDGESQRRLVDLLSSSPTEQGIDQYNCHHLESIIKKFNKVEDNDIFLDKVIKEIDEAPTADKVVKRVYSQILESMRYDNYLYETENGSSEADFIIKIYGPIMENVFRGSGCRLIWGDTKSPSCLKRSNESKLDLRVISLYTKTADLALSEFAKKAAPWKYYYDKKKAVIVSLIHLKEHIKNGNLNLEEAKSFKVPFVLFEGLESDIYTIRLVSEDWTVVEKLKDIDVPSCVQEVKDGKIKNYLQNLKGFKDMCLALKNKLQKNRQTTRGMRRINKKHPIVQKLLKKAIWVDPFTDTSEEEEDDDDDDQ
ncbi:hypothetical protein G6F62_007682 [Rhizopus arrhizus]|nr:hypothetical protein G6F62_007682 [Rhizopus arrhizus]